jgi:hypothetical protein
VRREALDQPLGSEQTFACLSEGGAKRLLREVTARSGQANFATHQGTRAACFTIERASVGSPQLPPRYSMPLIVSRRLGVRQLDRVGGLVSGRHEELADTDARSSLDSSDDELRRCLGAESHGRLRVERPGDDRQRVHPRCRGLGTSGRALLAGRRKDESSRETAARWCSPSTTGSGTLSRRIRLEADSPWIGTLRCTELDR